MRNDRQTVNLKKKYAGTTCVLSCVIAVFTAVSLILPALAVSNKETVLDCTCEVHEHTDECYKDTIDEEGNIIGKELVCGQADYVIHTHDEHCYQDGELICTLDEHEEHIHDDSCYEEQKILSCGKEESTGHIHDENCYQSVSTLVCDKEEHVHDETCYGEVTVGEETVLICGREEGEAEAVTEEGEILHVHNENCYETVPVTETQLICGKEEHAHDETCYEVHDELICTQAESEGHVHTEECYTAEKILTCDKEEQELHEHTDECYAEIKDEEGNVTGKELICGKTELKKHVHDDSCMKETETAVIAAETYPAQEFTGSTDTVEVSVSAPEGAFPEGTQMTVSPVEDAETIENIRTAAEGTVREVYAADITFRNKDGKEIEPLCAISVRMKAVQKNSEESGLQVVHVDDAGEAQVVEGNEEEAEVSFETEHFSVYALVETVIEDTVLASDGHNYRITAKYGPETGIPAEAVLHADEITADSPLYETYVADTENVFGLENGSAGYIRLFDIRITDQNDETVIYQPAEGTSVNISVELADIPDTSVSVVHFSDHDKADALESAVDGDAVSFDTGSFSVFAIAVFKDLTEQTPYMNICVHSSIPLLKTLQSTDPQRFGNPDVIEAYEVLPALPLVQVTINITDLPAADAGQVFELWILKNGEISAREAVSVGSEVSFAADEADAFALVRRTEGLIGEYGVQLTGNFPEGAYASVTAAEPVETEDTPPVISLAYDIKIYDADGKEWQPAEGESVECFIPYEGASEDLEQYYWMVLHTSNGVTEQLWDAYPVEGGIYFSTTSFSTFTLQGRKDTGGLGKTTVVHFVDHQGNDIQGMTSGTVIYNYHEYCDLYQYQDDLNPAIAGEYEFSRAYVQLSGIQTDIRYLYLGRAYEVGGTDKKYRVYMFMNSLDECRPGGTYAGTWYTGDDTSPTNDVYLVFNHVEDISFKKVDSEGEPLAGAGFTMYTDSSCINVLTYNGSPVTAISDENGQVHFGRIPYGSYYMKETTVPAGIKEDGTVYPVNVNGNTEIADVVNEDDDGSVIVKETRTMRITKEWSDGEAHSNDSVTIKVYDGSTEAGSVTLNARNNWSQSLSNLDPTVSYMVSETNVTSSGEDVTNGWIPEISTSTASTTPGYYQTDVFQEGEQYVLVYNSYNRRVALSNDRNSLDTSSVTVQGNMLTSTVNNNMLWTVESVSDDGVISLRNAGNNRYLNLNNPNYNRREWGFSNSAPQFIRYTARNGTVQIFYRENMNAATAYYLNGTGVSTSSGTNFTLYKKVNVRTENVTVTNRPAEYPVMFRKLAYSGSTAIPGAVFSLYTEEEYNNGNLGTPSYTGLTSGADGYLTADGTTHIQLLAGSYYLVETQAADGYVDLSKPVHFSISRGGRFVARSADQEFTDYTYASTVTDGGVTYPLLQVPNQKKITLTFKAEDGVDRVKFESGEYISISGDGTKELTVVIPEVTGSSVRVRGVAEDGMVINGWTVNDGTAKLTEDPALNTAVKDDPAATDKWTDRTYHVWAETEKIVEVFKEVTVLGTVTMDEIDTTAYFVVWDHARNRNVLDENGNILIQSIKIINGEPQGIASFGGLTSGTYSVWEVDKDGRDLAAGTVVIGEDIAVSRITTRHDQDSGNRVILTDTLPKDGITVSNTYNHKSDVVDWTVSKEWYTSKNSMQAGQANLNVPENASSTLVLYRKDDLSTPLQTVVLDGVKDDNGETEPWKALFTEIPVKDSAGNTLEYIVKETSFSPETTPEGLYITAYTDQTDHDGGTIRNAVLYGDLKINKEFSVQPEMDLSGIIGNLQITVTGPHGYNQTFNTLTGSGSSYQLTIPDLPEGTYHVKEVNYEDLITGRKWNAAGSYINANVMPADQSDMQGQNQSGQSETDVLVGTWSQSTNDTVDAEVRIKNDYLKYDIRASKVWSDADTAETHEDVVFTLYRTDGQGNKTKVGDSKTIAGDAAGEDLTVIWEQQDQQYEYVLEETPVYGYDTQVSGDALNGFTVTNTPKQETVLSVVKQVEGSDEAKTRTFKVKVTPDGFPEYAQTIELKPVNGQDTVQLSVPYGAYTVEELVTDASDPSYTIEIDDYDRTTRISAGSAGGEEGTSKSIVLQEEEAVITIKNSYKRQTTDVSFRKLDGSDHNVSLQAVFQMEYSTDNDHYATVNNGQINGVTDSLFTIGTGGTSLALPDGYYRLTERTAPDEYHRMSGTLVFSVTEGVIALSDPASAADYASEIIQETDGRTIGIELYNYKKVPVSIQKTDVNGSVITSGASFVLYKADNFNDETQHPIEADQIIVSGTTDTDGILALGELEIGEYRLVETEAPAGYLLPEHAMKIFVTINGISAMQETGNSTILFNGDEGWVNKQDERTAQIQIWNNPGAVLPKTGGPGTDLVYCIGLMLICIAGAGLLRRRSGRREA